jgi:hypothetical protein
LSSSRDWMRFAPIAQTSVPGTKPLAAQNRVLRGGSSDDDVLLRGVPVVLARFGSEALAKRGEAFFVAGVGDDPLELGECHPHALDLRLSLPARPDDSERVGLRLGQVPSGHCARRSRAPLTDAVSLDEREHLWAICREEDDDEPSAVREPGVGLQPPDAELEIDSGHDVEEPTFEAEPGAWLVLDSALR